MRAPKPRAYATGLATSGGRRLKPSLRAEAHATMLGGGRSYLLLLSDPHFCGAYCQVANTFDNCHAFGYADCSSGV
jgi:hypothetical protein